MVDYSLNYGTLAPSHRQVSTSEIELKASEATLSHETRYRNQPEANSGLLIASPGIKRTLELQSDFNQTNYPSMNFEMIPNHNNLAYSRILYPHFDTQGSEFMNQTQIALPNPGQFLRMEKENEVRGRAENWHYAETKQFLDILLSHRHQLTDLRRHPSVWETVASELQMYGYDRSVDKCKNRWKVLVAKYKKYTEKSQKGRLRQTASIPPSQIKIPDFLANEYNPDIAINYHYYNTIRSSSKHSGTGGFEFYAEMHELLQFICSSNQGALLKRRNNLPLSHSTSTTADQNNFISPHNPESFPLIPTHDYHMNRVQNMNTFPSQLLPLPNQTVLRSPFHHQHHDHN